MHIAWCEAAASGARDTSGYRPNDPCWDCCSICFSVSCISVSATNPPPSPPSRSGSLICPFLWLLPNFPFCVTGSLSTSNSSFLLTPMLLSHIDSILQLTESWGSCKPLVTIVRNRSNNPLLVVGEHRFCAAIFIDRAQCRGREHVNNKIAFNISLHFVTLRRPNAPSTVAAQRSPTRYDWLTVFYTLQFQYYTAIRGQHVYSILDDMSMEGINWLCLFRP